MALVNIVNLVCAIVPLPGDVWLPMCTLASQGRWNDC
jgi:hypothetical protein